MKCPECGSLGPFNIAATVWIEIYDEGIEEYQDSEWDGDSACSCRECGHADTVSTYMKKRSK
jgi:hypothetical protein